MGAPCYGLVFVLKNHYPRSRENFLIPSSRRHTHPFGGLGFRRALSQVGRRMARLLMKSATARLGVVGSNHDRLRPSHHLDRGPPRHPVRHQFRVG